MQIEISYPKSAVCVLKSETVNGIIYITDYENITNIEGKITGLTPNKKHGFHIHANGDLRDEGCMGACLHYNKGPKRLHGGAPSTKGERHTGDLGNIELTDHLYSYKLADVNVSELLGRTLIVHADPDDLGKGGEADSLITGHSGKRISCALIGRAKDCEEKKTRKIKLK